MNPVQKSSMFGQGARREERRQMAEQELRFIEEYKKDLLSRQENEALCREDEEKIKENLALSMEKSKELKKAYDTGMDDSFSDVFGRTVGYDELFIGAAMDQFNEYFADGDISQGELSSLVGHYQLVLREYAIASDFLNKVNNMGPEYAHLKDSARQLVSRLNVAVRQARWVSQKAKAIYQDKTSELAEATLDRNEKENKKGPRGKGKKGRPIPQLQLDAAGASLLMSSMREVKKETPDLNGMTAKQRAHLINAMSPEEREASFSEVTAMLTHIYSYQEEKEMENAAHDVFKKHVLGLGMGRENVG